ncbi:uncharacterized protein HaLaN_27481, partial [Haematococcus lacustris]
MAGSAEEYDIDLQTVIKALNVLMNVSANDDLAVRIGQMPGCIDTLSRLQAHKHAPLAVLAARCLINLTHSNPAAASAADKAGALNTATIWLLSVSSTAQSQARIKLGCWLLGNLATAPDATCRAKLLGAPGVIQRLVELLTPGSPEAIIVLSAQLLSSLARESYTAQTLLAKAGAVGALMQLVEAHSGSCLEDGPSQATLKCK